MKKISILIVAVISTLSAYAQSGFEGIVAAGEKDANTLMGAYIAPVMEGLVYSMAGGWYHTAKTHKKFGFDLTIGFNGAIVPSDKESFLFSDLQFENNITATPNASPTVAGNIPASTVTVTTNQGFSTSFTMPEGVKDDLPLNAVPAPTLQASLGLLFDTDIIVRYTPEVGSDDVKGSIYGAGLKHNLMQYFGPMDNLPLNVAILGGFSKMNIDYDIQDGSSIDGENQRAEFRLNSYTVQGIASLDFPLISLYAGLGYTGGTSELNVLGTYEVSYNANLQSVTYTDPIALSFDPSGMRASLGARLNLAFFKIYADYTVQEYNNLSAGVAFSFN